MKVKIQDGGFSIELSGQESLVLLEELGSVSSRNQKIRQLYGELDRVLSIAGSAQQKSKVIEISSGGRFSPRKFFP
jgi:hypothetical protein